MVACKKVKTVPNHECGCEDFKFAPDWIGTTYISIVGTQYKNPYFNPTNSGEFVYYVNTGNSAGAIKKYNLSTGQSISLVENISTYGQSKWSTSGWIAFTRAQGYVDHIFIVKENGDSLRQFTTNTSNLFPAWSSDGNTLFWQYTPVLGYPYYLLKQDLYGSIPDTVLDDYAGFSDISVNDVIVSRVSLPPSQNIFLATSQTNNLNFSPQIEFGYGSVEGLSWHPNGYEFFYSESVDGGLKKFNTVTKQTETLFCHCDSKYYKSPSCSPDGTKLIAERVDMSLQFNNNGDFTGNIIQKSSIVLIDLQTLSESTILE